MDGTPNAPSRVSLKAPEPTRSAGFWNKGIDGSRPVSGSSVRSTFARLSVLLCIAFVSGSLLGFSAARAGAEPLEMPGPIVEYPATTRFRLVPVEQTHYVRFAREFFAGAGSHYVRDSRGAPFAHAILAGRHRITGGAVPDLVLMVVPLVRPCCDLAEVDAIVFERRDKQWHKSITTQGFGTAHEGALLALVSPIVGVTYPGGSPDDIDPPFWVPPMRDSRRTIVWNDGGMFWNGSKWEFFCWRQCGERG
jgi:hypothetical protein